MILGFLWIGFTASLQVCNMLKASVSSGVLTLGGGLFASSEPKERRLSRTLHVFDVFSDDSYLHSGGNFPRDSSSKVKSLS